MLRTEIDPNQFEPFDLWNEAVTLGQELPVVDGESVMYVGRVSLAANGPGETAVRASQVNWEDSDGNKVEFGDTVVRGTSQELLELTEGVGLAMGAPFEARSHYITFRDDDVWASRRPQVQADHARTFARTAKVITASSPGRRTLWATPAEDPFRSRVQMLARLNLHLARLVGDTHTAPYHDLVRRSNEWSPRNHTPPSLSWLTGSFVAPRDPNARV